MDIQGSRMYLLSSKNESSVILDMKNNFVYLAHSCLWLCFTEADFRRFVLLINQVEYKQRKNNFPLGKEGVLIRSALPGIGFRLEETDVDVLKVLLNSALEKLNYRTVVN